MSANKKAISKSEQKISAMVDSAISSIDNASVVVEHKAVISPFFGVHVNPERPDERLKVFSRPSCSKNLSYIFSLVGYDFGKRSETENGKDKVNVLVRELVREHPELFPAKSPAQKVDRLYADYRKYIRNGISFKRPEMIAKEIDPKIPALCSKVLSEQTV